MAADLPPSPGVQPGVWVVIDGVLTNVTEEEHAAAQARFWERSMVEQGFNPENLDAMQKAERRARAKRRAPRAPTYNQPDTGYLRGR